MTCSLQIQLSKSGPRESECINSSDPASWKVNGEREINIFWFLNLIINTPTSLHGTAKRWCQILCVEHASSCPLWLPVCDYSPSNRPAALTQIQRKKERELRCNLDVPTCQNSCLSCFQAKSSVDPTAETTGDQLEDGKQNKTQTKTANKKSNMKTEYKGIKLWRLSTKYT